MTMKFLYIIAFMTLCLTAWSGCDNSGENTILKKIPGTEGVDVWHPSISISPDGECMIIFSDNDKYENKGHRFNFQIETLNLRTGKIVRHRPADSIGPDVLKRIEKIRTTIGFWSAFREDSWRDGVFYIRIINCLGIDPRKEEYFDSKFSCPDKLRSSDTLTREELFEIEQKFRENGGLEDSKLIRILYGNSGELGRLTIPASVDRSKPVLYYVGAEKGNVVYRSNGKESERVHKYSGALFNRGITQIKSSPDGRYLAMIREKRIGAPVPIPGSGYDLTILDMGQDKKVVLKTSKIGSCVWTPDSKALYLACSDRGDGVYRLDMSDAFR